MNRRRFLQITSFSAGGLISELVPSIFNRYSNGTREKPNIIREPMIVKWHEVAKPNSVCNDYLIIEDFFPTILEMAGVRNYQTVQQIDGVSVVPMIKNTGTTATARDLFWHYPNKWGPDGPGIGATSTIRSGDWKLIYYYKDNHFELFNIAEDIGEQHNLVDGYPGKVKELAKKLGEYLRSVNAQRPRNKKTGKLVPFPDELLMR